MRLCLATKRAVTTHRTEYAVLMNKSIKQQLTKMSISDVSLNKTANIAMVIAVLQCIAR